MTAPDIATRVREIICDHLLHDRSEMERVVDGADIYSDLRGDSLDAWEIALALEEEFSIEIDDILFSSASTVGDIIKLVKEAKQP